MLCNIYNIHSSAYLGIILLALKVTENGISRNSIIRVDIYTYLVVGRYLGGSFTPAYSEQLMASINVDMDLSTRS